MCDILLSTSAFSFKLWRYTRGELLLLLRTVEDPNQLFLTGDTAQTIARGLSFRFQARPHHMCRNSLEAFYANPKYSEIFREFRAVSRELGYVVERLSL
jgi:hypothetical protein